MKKKLKIVLGIPFAFFLFLEYSIDLSFYKDSSYYVSE